MVDPNIIDGKSFAVDLRSRIGAAVAALKVEHSLTPVSYTHLTLPTNREV